MALYELDGESLSPLRPAAARARPLRAGSRGPRVARPGGLHQRAAVPVVRQARIAGGGIPDVLALDVSGRVVVIIGCGSA